MEDFMERKPRIAIIDDDAAMRQSLYDLLFENGFEPVPLRGSQDFFALGDDVKLDLALIDLRLDGESGLTLTRSIHQNLALPIVMLTGVGDDTDKILGLETGADDYILKPFNPRELVARVRAVLRRKGHPMAQVMAAPVADASTDSMQFGDMMLDREHRQLFDAAGEEVHLTNSEYRLLEYFLVHPNEIIPRPRLLAEIGSDLSNYVDRTIDVMILRLRRKIESVPSKPMHLQTRRGQGYIFVTDVETEA
ncbi:two-component system, OmpR family, phosphate regulon response regulator OmpR [Cohaesibacter gelatinilyticus]|uniref:Two-component system, OmpR family, phosphate regulon response regulator OmpR n=2 Tax=Cohaesibacter gelatinilyticus TaxID=372072 RepID=A0A285PIV5_9HYPH|nr:two-component system, OmpR family, phosphate regulon response regulator OmpR [Cohaesibacter gelatinilyticus]